MSAYLLAQAPPAATLLLALLLGRQAPRRLLFYLALLGLTLGLLPLQHLRLPLPQVAPAWEVIRAVAPPAPALQRQEIPDLVLRGTLWPTWIQAFLAIGILLFLLDVLRHRSMLRIMRRQARPLADAPPHDSKQERVAEPKVLLCNQVPAAMVTGLLNPTIWLHPDLAGSPQLAMVLAHEKTHIRQGDPWFTWWICLLSRLLWWNPLAWLFARLARRFLEMSCDERCARLLGQERYRGELARLALTTHLSALPGAAHLVAKGGSSQVARIVNLERKHPMKWQFILLFLLPLGGLSLVSRPLSTPGAAGNDQLPAMGDEGVTPPVFLQRVSPNWPSSAPDHPDTFVVVACVARSTGQLSDFEVKNAPVNPGFVEETILALEQWRIEPALVKGQPADVSMFLKVDFRREQPLKAEGAEKKSAPAELEQPAIADGELAPYQAVGNHAAIRMVQLEHAALSDVLSFLAQAKHLRLEILQPCPDPAMDYKLENIPWNELLTRVCRDAEISWAIDKGVLYAGDRAGILQRLSE